MNWEGGSLLQSCSSSNMLYGFTISLVSICNLSILFIAWSHIPMDLGFVSVATSANNCRGKPLKRQ